MPHGCQTLCSSGLGVYSLGHLVSVNATTPRASQHALTVYTGLGAANCHIPGKFRVVGLVTLYIVPHNTVQVTRRNVSDHHHAGKHTRVPQDCSLHNSLDCHVHPKQITVVFVVH